MLSRMNSVLVVALTLAAVLVGASGVAQAALVGYWKLDETVGTTAADSAGTATLTVEGTGTTLGVPGVIGTAFSFPANQSGSCGLRNLTGTTALGNTSNLTISTWVNLSSTSGRQYLFYDGSDSSSLPGTEYTLELYSGALYLAGQTGPDYSCSASSIPLNTWTLLTATWTANSSSGERLYVNGVQQGTAGPSNNTTLSGTTWPFVGGVTGTNTIGAQDDTAVWNQTLGAAQVKALYTAPTTFTTDAAAGFYGAGDMQSLFNLYAAQTGSVAINGKTWQYSTTGFNENARQRVEFRRPVLRPTWRQRRREHRRRPRALDAGPVGHRPGRPAGLCLAEAEVRRRPGGNGSHAGWGGSPPAAPTA